MKQAAPGPRPERFPALRSQPAPPSIWPKELAYEETVRLLLECSGCRCVAEPANC